MCHFMPMNMSSATKLVFIKCVGEQKQDCLMCAASNKHLCGCSLYRVIGKQKVFWAYAPKGGTKNYPFETTIKNRKPIAY